MAFTVHRSLFTIHPSRQAMHSFIIKRLKMTDQPETFDDEIELIAFLKIMWRRKYLILTGTLICAGIAAVISVMMPKVYRISMALRPAVMVDGEQEKTYLDRIEEIRGDILTGAYNNAILSKLQGSNYRNFQKVLKFRVRSLQWSNLLRISYDTTNVNLGITIMQTLLDEIRKKQDEEIINYRILQNSEIQSNTGLISAMTNNLKFLDNSTKGLQNRIIELEKQSNKIHKSNIKLIKEQDRLITNESKSNIKLLKLFYENLISQNKTLIFLYDNMINNLNERVVSNEVSKMNIEEQKQKLSMDIEKLEFAQKRTRNIEIVKPPIASKHAVRPNLKLNIFLGTLLGLVLMFFLSFCLEYFLKKKRQ